MIVLPLLLLAAAAAQATDHEPTPLTDPVTWFSSDDYPPAALRAGEEGAVKFALDVSPSGAVTACRIVESSGSSDLDAQTCSSAILHARFKPATNERGKPIAGSFVRRTRWVIPDDTHQIGDAGDPLAMWGMGMNMASAMIDVRVDADGRVTGCTRTRASATEVDPCLAFPLGKIVVAPTIRDGKAVAATIHVVTLISVAADDTDDAP